MSGTITRGKTFTANEEVTSTKLHALVDSATITDIDRSNFGTTARPCYISASAPASAIAGDLWYDTANSLLKIYNGASWLTLANTKYYVGSTTRDTTTATGTQAVTGVGFQPSAIQFLACQNGSLEYSDGFDDGTTAECRYFDGTKVQADATASIYDYHSSGNTYAGLIDSFDADGFTISWTKTGSPTGTLTVYFLAFK